VGKTSLNAVVRAAITDMKNVIAFSTGRTSGKMLKDLLDQHGDTLRKHWIVMFANTGKEQTESLDFGHEVETRWNIPLVWLEYTRVPAATIDPSVFPTPRRRLNHAKSVANGEMTHWFKVVDYKTASRNGEPFNEMLEWASVLPNQGARICTVQLKMRTMMRYLFSLGVHEWSDHIGIRADECDRAADILKAAEAFTKPQFPLIKAGTTEADVMRFWRSQPFDLQLLPYEGNCDLCFLKKKWKRLRIMRDRPGCERWWEGWEEKKSETTTKDGNRWVRGQSITALKTEAHLPFEMRKVHPEEKLLEASQFEDTDTDCSCTSGAYSWKDDD